MSKKDVTPTATPSLASRAWSWGTFPFSTVLQAAMALLHWATGTTASAANAVHDAATAAKGWLEK